MKTLNENLSIEVWKEIANKVQELILENYEMTTFNANLKLLESFLEDLDIDIHGNSNQLYEATPKTLLRMIYNIKESIPKKKAVFYENIYALDELGIQTIALRPNPIDNLINDISTSIGDPSYIKKCLTDGSFILSHNSSSTPTVYSMIDIEDAQFLLNISLIKTGEIIQLDTAQAILKSFGSISHFPSKEEVMRFHYPQKISIEESLLEWEEYPRVKEVFDPFNKETSQFQKRFVKSKEYYYKSES